MRATKNDLLRNTQHRFCTGRSVQTNLIDFLSVITKWIDEGWLFDVLYLDFVKVFDKADQGKLISKLNAVGITGGLSEWIEDWLRGRLQRVKVEGCFFGMGRGAKWHSARFCARRSTFQCIY